MSDKHGDTDDQVAVPLAEETLEATVTDKVREKVLLHNRVETEPARQEVTLRRDEVTVERIPRNEVITARREPWYEGVTRWRQSMKRCR
jgi:stress response protein YsnF